MYRWRFRLRMRGRRWPRISRERFPERFSPQRYPCARSLATEQENPCCTESHVSQPRRDVGHPPLFGDSGRRNASAPYLNLAAFGDNLVGWRAGGLRNVRGRGRERVDAVGGLGDVILVLARAA